VNISEKKIREFLSFIKLYEYPQAISLDEDGYFSLEIKRNDFYIAFIFRKRLKFYFYKNDQFIMSSEIKNIKDFFSNINYDVYNLLFSSYFEHNDGISYDSLPYETYQFIVPSEIGNINYDTYNKLFSNNFEHNDGINYNSFQKNNNFNRVFL
ncbi:hypothetical protein, partial [Brachyspira pilosicoli]